MKHLCFMCVEHKCSEVSRDIISVTDAEYKRKKPLLRRKMAFLKFGVPWPTHCELLSSTNRDPLGFSLISDINKSAAFTF